MAPRLLKTIEKTELATSVFLIETFDPAFGIDEFHLTSEEGMANITDVDLHQRHSSARGELVSTGATDLAQIVFRVNILFHSLPSIPLIRSCLQ